MHREINRIKRNHVQFILKATRLKNNFKNIDVQYDRRVKNSEHFIFMHTANATLIF